MQIEALIPDGFSGVVSVWKHSEPVFQQSYGCADLPNQVPNGLNTRFATASAGKTFVAVAILQMVGQGRLAMDSRLGDLVDFDLKAIDPGITVRQLLNHTSGIPDYFNEYEMDDYAELWRDCPNYKIRSSADLIPLFIDKPMMYEPGARFQYNNTGYAVLGLILERLTGLPFDEHLKQAVFTPCGMADSGYFELDRLPARCANAYILDEARNEYYTNIYSVDAKGTGAGGAFITLPDIGRFWQGLMGGKLLTPDLLAQMTGPQEPKGQYGYGVWMEDIGGKLIPQMTGCDPGVSFVSSFDAEKGLCVALVSNFGCDVWTPWRAISEGIC